MEKREKKELHQRDEKVPKMTETVFGGKRFSLVHFPSGNMEGEELMNYSILHPASRRTSRLKLEVKLKLLGFQGGQPQTGSQTVPTDASYEPFVRTDNGHESKRVRKSPQLI